MSAYLSEARFALDEFTVHQALTIAKVFFKEFSTDAFSQDVEEAGLMMERPLGSCSSGEQRMIDALLMLHSGRALIIIDEVFAHLDSKRAGLVERAIVTASQKDSVVIATQEETIRSPSPAPWVTYQVQRQNGEASICAL
jgi:ABC-type transport system involved in cytochrome c biogenesis ATPase subunit